jgi:hypothetical protein
MYRSRWAVWGLAVSSVVVLATGVATAATSATSTTYTACASSKHVLSVEAHKKCPKGTKKVTIAARGPAGAKGAKGSPGTAGPSNVYEYTYAKNGGSDGTGGGTAPPLTGSPSATLFTLPPGSYVMHYDVGVFDSSGIGWVSCVGDYGTGIDAPIHNGQTMYASIAASSASGNYGTGSMTEPLTVTTSTPVAVTCDESINSSMELLNVDITATQTGSLTATGFAPH